MNYRHGITIQKRKRKKPYLVRWKGEYNFRAGKYIRPGKSFLREKDAKNFADQLQDELDKGLDPKNRVIPVGDFLKKYLEIKKTEVRYKTYQRYKQAVNEFQKYFHPSVPLRKITQEDCEKFLSQVDFVNKYHKNKGKKLSESSRHQYLRKLKTVFEKACDWEYVLKNPFKKITMKTPARKAWYYIKPHDFEMILDVVDNLRVSKKRIEKDTIRKIRLKAFYGIMYGCGLRFGEAVNLLWDDQNIDFKNKMVHIVNREGSVDMPVCNVKDYEARSLKMPDDVVEAIRELQKVDGKSSPFVFLCKDQWERVLKRWHTFQERGIVEQWDSKEIMGSARRDFQRYCKKAGIITHKKLDLHSLRKGYGSNMHKICPIDTLRKYMGHSSIVTTIEYYVQDSDANMDEAVEALNKMMREGKKGCSQTETTAIDYSI